MEKKNNTKSKKTNNTKKKTTTNKKVATKKPNNNKTANNTKKKSTQKTVKPVVKKEEVKAENKPKETVKPEVVKTKNEPIKNNSDFGGDEIRKLLIIIGAVCAVMLAFYFITEVVLKNKKDNSDKNNDTENKTEVQIQYEKILMGSILKQNEKDYYVLVYDEKDPLIDIYNQYIESYKKTENGPLKVYKVNLSEDFNKSYVAESSYLTGNDVTQIRVTGTTLIRVSDGSVYKSFEGDEAIIGRFNYMLGKN